MPKRKSQRDPVVPSIRNRAVLVALALLVLTLIIYYPAGSFDFVNYDDPDYVTHSPHVTAGLTMSGVVWAFTSQAAGNWHPLTWLSHMLVCQFFGLDSGAHHFTNVALHALNTLLVFWVFRRLTGALWSSACVAFLFGLHPLHVESVAWVSERKDVLSGAFWFLTILAYRRFVERRSVGRYLLVVVCFVLGLMSKAMVVTLPLVLTLLDIWPLRRGVNVREKVPLFACSLAASVVTFIVQRHAGAVSGFESSPLIARAGNACISYVAYLVDAVWPSGLSVFYPMPAQVDWFKAVAAGAVVIGLSFLAWRSVERRPYFFVGWFWYLVTLVPVIGLVQVGSQARADRYTYLPLVGIFVIAVWGLSETTERWPRAKGAVVAVGVVALVGWTAVTVRQLSYWRGTATLFQHALEVNPENYIAMDGLGNLAREQGRAADAVVQYQAGVRVRPSYEPLHVHLADALLAENRAEDSLAEVDVALTLNSADAEAYVNRGAVLMRLNRFAEAEGAYRQAVSIQPDDAVGHSGLGMALVELKRSAEGLEELQRAVRLDPGYAAGHFNVGRVLGVMGQSVEAIGEFSLAVQLEPENPEARFNLGTALGNDGRYDEAIREFTAALRLRPDYFNARLNLGRLFAAKGMGDEAVGQLREALRIRPESGEARQALEDLGAGR